MAKKKDDSEIIQEFDDVFGRNADPSKVIREITMFKNILFYLGEQWISWFDEQGGWGFRFEMNTIEPTPVSNLIRDYIKSMNALVLNKRYLTRIWPNSESIEDVDGAEIGEILLKNFETAQCNESEDVKELICFWNNLTGNGFARTFRTTDNGCYVKGKDGAISRSDVVVENVIPFNVHVPLLGVRLRDKTRVGISGLKEREWVEDTFKIKIESGDDISAGEIEYEKNLMTLVANASPWKGRAIESNNILSRENSKLVMFREMEYRPSIPYPDGRYAVVVNKQVVKNENKMPIAVSDDGDWEYTVTDFKYNHTPGSFWATSGVDDLISPQIIINEIDRAMASNRKSLGRPYVITADDLIVKSVSHEGQSFNQLKYDHRSAGGLKPEVQRGTPYPQQIIEERAIHKEVAQTASGDPKNVLRGAAPTSGASGKMVGMLQETAEASHSPDVGRFYRSWQRVKKKQLILAQEYKATRLLKMAGEGNVVLIKKFKGSDLHSNFDVRLELDSGLSSTRAGQNEIIVEMQRNGFFGDISQQPELQHDLFRRLGISMKLTSTSVHQDRARHEHSMISNAEKIEFVQDFNVPEEGPAIQIETPVWAGIFATGKNEKGEPVVLSDDPYYKYDNHQIHYAEHTKQILSKGFRVWPVDQQLLLINHNDMHNFSIQAEQQVAMEQAAQQQSLNMEAEQDNKPLPQGGAAQ